MTFYRQTLDYSHKTSRRSTLTDFCAHPSLRCWRLRETGCALCGILLTSKMANPAQCFYCFETLAASFDGREPAGLETIEELWEQHLQIKKLNAFRKKDEATSLGEDRSGEGLYIGDRPGNLRLPSISRLQSETSSTSESSSSPSPSATPSSMTTSATTITTPSVQSPPPETPALGRWKRRDRNYPLFVTWDTLTRGRKSLRGCIGTFEAQELEDGLSSYAIISYAFLRTLSLFFPSFMV